MLVAKQNQKFPFHFLSAPYMSSTPFTSSSLKTHQSLNDPRRGKENARKTFDFGGLLFDKDINNIKLFFQREFL